MNNGKFLLAGLIILIPMQSICMESLSEHAALQFLDQNNGNIIGMRHRISEQRSEIKKNFSIASGISALASCLGLFGLSYRSLLGDLPRSKRIASSTLAAAVAGSITFLAVRAVRHWGIYKYFSPNYQALHATKVLLKSERQRQERLCPEVSRLNQVETGLHQEEIGRLNQLARLAEQQRQVAAVRVTELTGQANLAEQQRQVAAVRITELTGQLEAVNRDNRLSRQQLLALRRDLQALRARNEVLRRAHIPQGQPQANDQQQIPQAAAVNNFHCTVCDTDVEIDQMIRLGCSHTYCRDCLLGLLNTAIHDRSAANLVCPDPGHPRTGDNAYSLDTEDIQDITEGNENARQIREDYQRIKALDFIRAVGPTARQCPGIDCPNIWTYEGPEGQGNLYRCFGCNGEYCQACCLPWAHHTRADTILTCAQARQLHERIGAQTLEAFNEREARELAIGGGGFYCLNCNGFMQRSEGCNHMICGQDTDRHGVRVNGCGYDFCIECMLPWNGHGNHWGGGACNYALQHHLGARNPWAIELNRWINEDITRRAVAQGRVHWMQFVNEHGGVEQARAFLHNRVAL